jgi:hypothetical protein
MIRPKAGSFKRETVQCDKTNRLAACADAQIPMLFLQGTRDTLASLDQLEPLCKKLGRRATLRGKTFAHSPFDLTLFVKRIIYGQISGEEGESYG